MASVGKVRVDAVHRFALLLWVGWPILSISSQTLFRHIISLFLSQAPRDIQVTSLGNAQST